jgi:hypothetical protein
MARKDDHQFFCTKKRIRKTAWDTPEYLTDDDWALSRKILTAKTGLDFTVAILEAFKNRTAEGFFNRVLGWPEGFHYCRSTSFIENSVWPGFVQHERDKLRISVDQHYEQLDLF